MIYDNYKYFLLVIFSSYIVCFLVVCICVLKIVHAERVSVLAAQVAV